jgi:hypothetical protein
MLFEEVGEGLCLGTRVVGGGTIALRTAWLRSSRATRSGADIVASFCFVSLIRWMRMAVSYTVTGQWPTHAATKDVDERATGTGAERSPSWHLGWYLNRYLWTPNSAVAGRLSH